MDKTLFKKLIYLGIIAVSVAGWMLMINGYGYAERVKSAKGLNFNVAEDWPIEKRGGAVAPIPVEEYVSIKFKAIEEEFQAIRDELSGKLDQFKSDLKSIEKSFSKEIREIQSQNELQEASGGSSGDIQAQVAPLETELGRLDRKITNKVQEMRMQFEKVSQQMESLKEDVKSFQTQIYKLDEKVDYIGEKPGSSY